MLARKKFVDYVKNTSYNDYEDLFLFCGEV